MAIQRHTAISAATSALTTQLNALADGAICTVSAAINNDDSGTRYLFGMFELAVTFASSPTAGKTVDLYIMPTLDGTNYADGTGPSTAPGDNCYVGSFAVRASASAQRLIISGVVLPPTDYKVLVRNSTGVAFTASGHTLKVIMSAYEVA